MIRAARLTSLGVALCLSACGGARRQAPATETSGTPGATAPTSVDTTGATGVPEAPPAAPSMTPEVAGHLDDAQRAAASGDLTTARAAVEAASSADRNAAEPHYNLGVLAERAGNYPEARQHYEDALKVQPEFGPAVTAIALMMLRQGDRDGATYFAQDRLSRTPQSNSVKNAVNRLRVATGDIEGAIRESTLVLRADEKNVEAMKILASARARQGKNELAAGILRSAAALDTNDPEIYAKLARAYMAMDEKPHARAALEKAVALPGGASAEVYNDLGLLYHEAGDFAGAEQMFRQALSRWPDFPAAQLNLGNALKGQQKYADAEAAMKRALDLSPSSADVLFNLGILYLDGQLPNVEPVVRLQQAVDYFQRYKQAPGRAQGPDPVDQYVAEANKRIEVEKKKAASARKDPKPAPAPASTEGGDK